MIRSIRELKKQMHDRLREEQIERDEEGGGGNPKRTLKLWYFYEILNVKHNM